MLATLQNDPPFWSGHTVLLGIGGGIAAYRALDLIRLLRRQGARVVPVLTPAAARFVTPLSAATLAGGPVYGGDFFDEHDGSMNHIRLGREASIAIVAPATANLMARLSQGMADDALTTLLLAFTGPLVLAPAMNSAMWHHAATQRHVGQLRADGATVVGPERGELACGEEGEGRLAALEAIIGAARCRLTPQILAGQRVVVTAGPTREAWDPVRYLGNRSSGRMGWALAESAARQGAQVTLVHGPVSLPPPLGVTTVAVEDARQMHAAVFAAVQAGCDVAILAAAVADFRPARPAEEKIRKVQATGEGVRVPQLDLVANPDILADLCLWRKQQGETAGPMIVGFAAETGADLGPARDKLVRKGCDLLVVNDVADAACGFGSRDNRVTLLFAGGAEEAWPLMGKDRVADHLWQVLVGRLRRADSGQEGT
ncbi:MAG: bifunctional phosphopantothenoylcysteine decarboxylase/phosphopantothenate--cysteine ligase CoaBC [Magnetococcus sp. WYHC-3]